MLNTLSSSSHPITVTALVEFLRSLLESAPSSSAQDPPSSLTQVIIDVIWTADAGVEDRLPNAKVLPTTDPLKVVYDEDRRRLADLVKSLVVRTHADRRLLAADDLVQYASILPPDACRESLETPLLQAAGLIHDATALEKKITRVRTAML